jgi:fructose-1-phosphate kinase PfkB-like protein
MVDRVRLAVTKRLPLSSVGAGISFVAGFVLGLTPAQVVAAALTATLVFSGLAFQSFGREKALVEAERN